MIFQNIIFCYQIENNEYDDENSDDRSLEIETAEHEGNSKDGAQ
jgi:hypothetical protein